MNREPMKSKKCYGKYKNVWLTTEELENFSSRYFNSDEMIEALSRWKFKKKAECVNDYAALLLSGKMDGKRR